MLYHIVYIIYYSIILSDKMAIGYSDLYSDIDWFYTNYDKFKENFRNKFVVVNNKNIVLSARNIKELKNDAQEKNIDLSKSVTKFVPMEDIILIL